MASEVDLVSSVVEATSDVGAAPPAAAAASGAAETSASSASSPTDDASIGTGGRRSEGQAANEGDGLAVSGAGLSALAHNIKSKGANAYYYAHATNLGGKGELRAYHEPVSARTQ